MAEEVILFIPLFIHLIKVRAFFPLYEQGFFVF